MTLAQEFRSSVTVARMLQSPDGMRRNDVQRARFFGERCALAKAEALLGQFPAAEWPELWRREWLGDLELANLPAPEQRALRDYANHAAAECWEELLRRYLERDLQPSLDDEARAVKLVETLRDDLPPELAADRDGTRTYLQDRQSGERLVVTSLRHAWRMVDEWHHLPG